MSEEQIKCTPLCEKHVALGAKMVPFAGWNMPVQYTGIIDEHNAVRNDCGVFDISHMGQFLASGPGTTDWLNSMFTNNLHKLTDGVGQYSMMLNERGGVIDDLIIYRMGEDNYFIVVNASMIDEDYAWLTAHKPEGVSLVNKSADFVGLAVQGPNCEKVFAGMCPGIVLPERNGILKFSCDGDELYVCRTGYTGENGFEFFCPAAEGVKWLEKVIASGAKPCGLGARDSLRLEMCYSLNGSDLSPEKTPLEAGLSWCCDLTKDFIGVEVLRKQKAEGRPTALVAIEYTGKGAPPRHGYEVQLPDGTHLGELCSGVLSPTLGKGIAMAYVPTALGKIGTEVNVIVRNKPVPAVIIKKPFLKK
ncbi:MAG: glycine cleavage system aminomethyltransferase GcvT [Akkermansia sp.]|nr:glycine cleavage system aminomethyltransferase GcvT [Akkermansia sp.]